MLKANSKKIKRGNSEIPRVVFSSTNKYLTVQAINDLDNKTILYLCTKDININENENKKNFCFKNIHSAKILGEKFANLLKDKKIFQIVFDRNGHRYHGKVKVFCDFMRGTGIKI